MRIFTRKMLLLLIIIVICNCAGNKENRTPYTVIVKLPANSTKYTLTWDGVDGAIGYNVYFGCADTKVSEDKMVKVNDELIEATEYKFDLPLDCNYDVAKGIHFLFGVTAVTNNGEGPKGFVDVIKISEILGI